MQSKNVIDIQSVRDAQDSKFIAVHVFDSKRALFRFIDNDSYLNCAVADLVPALLHAEELKNVCLLGSLTLLNNAGIPTEMLREKGAITSLQDFLELANAAVRDFKRGDRSAVKVLGKTINAMLKHWKSGLLSQCDHLLNQELNVRAVEIMASEWYQSCNVTDNELVEILHKRLGRHVQDETSAYLGELAIRQSEQKSEEAEVEVEDVHALIVGQVNYLHKLSDQDRAEYRAKVEKKIHENYFGENADMSDLNKKIKDIRDDYVMKRYQKGELSKVLSQRLDSDLSSKILSAIRINDVAFAEQSPELSKWICNEAHSKQNGRAVDRMNGFNEVVVSDFITNFKKGRVNAVLKRECDVYLMPLIDEVKFETDDEERAVVLQAVDCIVSKPTQLVDAERVQFVETVSDVMKDSVNGLIKASDNEAGKALIGSFCAEILNHLNCSRSAENFNDPDKISALFNKDEVLLLSKIELRTKAGVGMFSTPTKPEVAPKPASTESAKSPTQVGPSK